MIDVRLEQPLKAQSPILLTVPGIEIDTRFLQFINASIPIPLTVYFSPLYGFVTTDGINTDVQLE